jgi:hypothetical protein
MIAGIITCVGFLALLFIGIWAEAHSKGLTLKEWLDICDEDNRRTGEALKHTYLGDSK